MSQPTDDGQPGGAVLDAPRLPEADDEGREGLMASVVDEIGSLMVEAKRTIAAAASRFDPDVPPTAFYVLRYVMKHQPCTAGEIVRAMAMDKGAVSRQVALLREAGFVDVVADASDGRVSMLRSTERAEARMLEVRHENRAVFRSHVEGWTDDELGQFSGWLHRFNTPAGPR